MALPLLSSVVAVVGVVVVAKGVGALAPFWVCELLLLLLLQWLSWFWLCPLSFFILVMVVVRLLSGVRW